MDHISWRSSKFFITYDFEKLRDASVTGINTSSGDLMIIRIRAAPGVSTTSPLITGTSQFGDNMFIVLEADNILNIAQTGTSIER